MAEPLAVIKPEGVHAERLPFALPFPASTHGVPIHVEYAGGREPKLNLAWAEKLADSAGKVGGLIIIAEACR
jgi:hypothetical protein